MISALFCCLSVLAQADAAPAPPNFELPLLGAHRGGRNLWPENTAYAFEQAAKRWPDILLEGDIHLSADGVPVLIHDASVDRTTDGEGLVANMTVEQLKKLDAGYRFTPDKGATFPHRGTGVTIPTLVEALAAAPSHKFEFELKAGGVKVVEETVRVLKESSALGRVLLASFNPMYMKRLQELAPNVATCYDYPNAMILFKTLRQGDWAGYTPTHKVLSNAPNFESRFEITPDEIKRIRDKGIKYQIHTLNKPEEIGKYLEIGVDSILSDDPELLAREIAAKP